MMPLDASWEPGFGQIYTWFAVDKNGLVAMMVNNCYGDLPRALLKLQDCDVLLDKVSEYIWEESAEFSSYPRKCGDFILDCYSFWRYRNYSRESLTDKLVSDLGKV
jgi:hypothetical protein